MNGDGLAGARAFVRRVQKVTAFAALLIGGVLAAVWSGRVGFGFLAGTAVGMINFQLMSVDTYEAAIKPTGKVRKFVTVRVLVRFAIMFGFLAVVATRTDFSIAATFLGLFFGKVILVGDRIMEGLGRSGGKYRG